MVHDLSLLILALAVSVDSFGVGMTYGLRKVVIPMKSIGMIAIFSGLAVILAMLIGQGIGMALTPEQAEVLGGFLIVGIGVWALYQVYRSPANAPPQEDPANLRNDRQLDAPNNLLTFEIKTFGIVIQILRRPLMADIDHSGVISMGEACVLGLALSLDAFGAGISAALFGYPILLTTVTIALMSSVFLVTGTLIGHFSAQYTWKKSFSYLPGMILVLFGIMKMF